MRHPADVTRPQREHIQGHKAGVLWCAGLSGAGKSPIAHAVEDQLGKQGCRTYVIDGDNVRTGIFSDLGFSNEDGHESILCIGEADRLFADAGVIVLAAGISPFRADRDWVRQTIGTDFSEIYCSYPIEICEAQDVKGLYKTAHAGQICYFTGVGSPYEPSKSPQLTVNRSNMALQDCRCHGHGAIQ